jgi:ferredoxin
MDGDTAKVKVAKVPADAEETCREAMEGCPVEAISMVIGQ